MVTFMYKKYFLELKKNWSVSHEQDNLKSEETRVGREVVNKCRVTLIQLKKMILPLSTHDHRAAHLVS